MAVTISRAGHEPAWPNSDVGNATGLLVLRRSLDARAAGRYLAALSTPRTQEEPRKPAARARPENMALTAFFEKAGFSLEDATVFREAFLMAKDTCSNWFVHPTAMGPYTSLTAQREASAADDHWSLLVQVLAHGIVAVIGAAMALEVSIPVEVVLSRKAAARLLKRVGDDDGDAMLQEMYSVFAERLQLAPAS